MFSIQAVSIAIVVLIGIAVIDYFVRKPRSFDSIVGCAVAAILLYGLSITFK